MNTDLNPLEEENRAILCGTSDRRKLAALRATMGIPLEALEGGIVPELLGVLQAMVNKHIADHGLLLVGTDHPVGRASVLLAKARAA